MLAAPACCAVACRLNGHEVAIDRATPKEDGRTSHSHSTTLGSKPIQGSGTRRSFDNGAGIVGPGLTPMMTYQQQLSQMLADPAGMAASLANGLRLSEEQQRDLSNAAAELATSHFNAAAAAAAAACADFNAAAAAAAAEQAACCPAGGSSPLLPSTTAAMLCHLNNDPTPVNCHHSDGNKSPNTAAMDVNASANAAATAAAAAAMAAMAQGMPLPSLAGLPGLLGGLPHGMAGAPLGGMGKSAGLFPPSPMGPGFAPLPGLPGPLGPPLCPPDAFGASLFPGLQGLKAPLPPAAAPSTSRKSLDSVLAPNAHRRSSENPAIQSVRAGPRIFIGKLTKDTTEADVKEYFGRFGFVMDVYMPKAKDNKAEHRGFGFVTFETDAAIKRVVGAGTHKLKGSTIAIDIAMPKLDEELGLDLGLGALGGGPAAPAGGLGMPGNVGGRPLGNPNFDAMAAGMMAAAAAAQQFSVRSSMPLM